MPVLYQTHTSTVHAITVQLYPGHSRADQSRFYKRMRLALRRNRIISVAKAGICLNLGPSGGDARREREVIVDWLIDQPAVRRIELLGIRSLQDVLDELCPRDASPAPPPASLDHIVVHDLLCRLLMGVIVQGIPLYDCADEV
jgi:hypothetical protein